MTGDSGKSYMKLFDFIDKQQQADDKQIEDHFKQAAFIRQPHVMKNYLYQLIMKSLRSFHEFGHHVGLSNSEAHRVHARCLATHRWLLRYDLLVLHSTP